MNYTWKITYIGEIQTVGKNQMQKRTIVLEEVSDNNYKGGIAFDIIKDKINLIDWFDLWDVVEVSLNFKASEYNWKYYTNISAWKIARTKEWLGNHSFPEDDWSLPF